MSAERIDDVVDGITDPYVLGLLGDDKYAVVAAVLAAADECDAKVWAVMPEGVLVDCNDEAHARERSERWNGAPIVRRCVGEWEPVS